MSSYSDYDEIYKPSKKTPKESCSDVTPCFKQDCTYCYRRFIKKEVKKEEDKTDKTLTFIIIVIGVLVVTYLLYKIFSTSNQSPYTFPQYIPQPYYSYPPMSPMPPMPPIGILPQYYYPQHDSPTQPIIIIQSPTPPSK